MNLKSCSVCKEIPVLQNDELGFIYRFICPKCKKSTRDILSPNASIANPHADQETMERLMQLWNNEN